MGFKLLGQPMVEEHAENIIHLFVRDMNGAPMSSARIKIWAGPAPTGLPAYWTDDSSFRNPGASGMLEFITMNGPMPEDRDYWMQALDAGGNAQSDALQFHFPRGKAIWITATLQQEGAATSAPAGASSGTSAAAMPMPGVTLDPRLATMHVTIQTLNPAPGQAYWKIIAAQFQDVEEAGGNHHVYYTILDEAGRTVPNVPVQFDWDGREANDVPNQMFSDGNGTSNQPMYHGAGGWRPEEGAGPYKAWVGDPDLRGRNPTNIPGEKILGMGLPMNRHVNFIVTWKKVTAGAMSAAQPAPVTQPATPPPAPAPKPAPTAPPPAQPAPAGDQTYTVQKGDTMFAIARKFGVSVDAISKANNITNPSLIKPAQVLKIPKK